VAPGRMVICCVGRFLEWKGQEVLVRALARLERGTVHVWLVGGPPAGKEHVVEAVRRLVDHSGLHDEVTFVGEVPSGEAVMGASDVVVVPSDRPEPFGLVVLEAFRAGTAVVASRHGSPADMISDGVSGLLFEPGDDADLARQLRRLRDEPALRAELARGGRAALSDYSVDHTVDLVEAAYDDVLAGWRP
jgi:glycosyltransferase involved in cell wall biosynthesis